MLERVVRLLACPRCQGDLARLVPRRKSGGRISRAELRCRECQSNWRIEQSVGRFGRSAEETRRGPPETVLGHFPSGTPYPRAGLLPEALEAQERTISSMVRTAAGWSGFVLALPAGDGALLQRASMPGETRQFLVGVEEGLGRALRLESLLRQVRRYARVSLVEARSDRLPLRSSSMNGALCLGALQELPHARSWIGELSRVLRPRAPLLLGGWISEEGALTLAQAARAHLEEALTEPRLREVLRSSGFSLESLTLVDHRARWPRSPGAGLPLEGDPWSQVIVSAHRDPNLPERPAPGEGVRAHTPPDLVAPPWLGASPRSLEKTPNASESPGISATTRWSSRFVAR